MKRMLSLLLALVLCCGLFGCGGSDAGEAGSGTSDAGVAGVAADAAALSPLVVQAYTLTMNQEREFVPELGTEAAYVAEYTYTDPEGESLHLLLLRFDRLNQIPFPNTLYTPDCYYVVYDMDADKIYDSEMMYGQIQGVLTDLTARDELLLQVLGRFSDEYRTGCIYDDGETLCVIEGAGLESVNAKLGEMNGAAEEAARQLLLDTAEQFLANPPKGYTASGSLFHGVEYRNPDVYGAAVHCYLMDIRGQFRSKSDYTTRVLLALDAETGEFYTSLDAQYRNLNTVNPENRILKLLKNYDLTGIDTSEIYYSSGETIVLLYGESASLAPALTQEALSAKAAEIANTWLADSGDILTESVYVRKVAQVRMKAYEGYAVDIVFIQLEGVFRDSGKPDSYPAQDRYLLVCDLSSGGIYTQDEASAFMNTAPESCNDLREIALSGVSGYREYLSGASDRIYSGSEERIELRQSGIVAANKVVDHQIPEEKLNP